MARIGKECIRQARETSIRGVWSRLGLPAFDSRGMAISPFREDRNPGCQVGGDRNLFTDYSMQETLDPIALVRKARGCGFKEAVAFVLGRPLGDLIESPARQSGPKTSCGSSPSDAIEELAGVRGWRPEAIRALGAESRNAQAPREVHFPMRDGAGAVVGFRRRRSDGKPFSDGPKAKAIKNSKNGLFCPWPLPQQGPLLVVEGEADACAALSAGFAAMVATPGASVPKMVVSALQKAVAEREVVLFPDPGEPGRKWLERVGRALANARCAVRFVPADAEDLDERLRRLSDTARMLFPVVAPRHVFFQRGGRMVEIADLDGEPALCILTPDAFRSRIERHFEVVVYRAGPNDSLLLKPQFPSPASESDKGKQMHTARPGYGETESTQQRRTGALAAE